MTSLTPTKYKIPNHEPLQITFVADPPHDFSVQLINILVRQIESEAYRKDDILAACKFILDKYNKKEDV